MLTAAHRATQALVAKLTADDIPDGVEFDAAVAAEDDAMRMLAAASCNEQEFRVKIAYIIEVGKHDFGELCHSKPFGSVAIAAAAYIEQHA
jgi:hypothetical protein